MIRPPVEPSVTGGHDPWEVARAAQRRFWTAQPVERRVAWLEEAVAMAYRAGVLPRRPDVDRDRAPVVPLAGSADVHAEAETARTAVLDRVRRYCRGPVPPGADPSDFAMDGAELQFALWRQDEPDFWIELRDAPVEAIAARMKKL